MARTRAPQPLVKLTPGSEVANIYRAKAEELFYKFPDLSVALVARKMQLDPELVWGWAREGEWIERRDKLQLEAANGRAEMAEALKQYRATLRKLGCKSATRVSELGLPAVQQIAEHVAKRTEKLIEYGYFPNYMTAVKLWDAMASAERKMAADLKLRPPGV